MESTKSERWRKLCLSLYCELIIDGNPGARLEDVDKFIKAYEWFAEGTVTEQEFSELYSAWLQSRQSEVKRKVAETDLTMHLSRFQESTLDSMLGLLIREHNKTLHVSNSRRTPSWIQHVENIYFTMDTCGYGIITFDEIQYLVLALSKASASEDEPSPDEQELVSSTLEFMKDVGHYDGVMSLRKFKNYCHVNGFEESTLQAMLQCLDRVLKPVIHAYNRLTPTMSDDCELPQLWMLAIQDTQKTLQPLYRRLESISVSAGDMSITKLHSVEALVRYLLHGAYCLRISLSNKLFENESKSCLLLFKKYSEKDEQLLRYLRYAKQCIKQQMETDSKQGQLLTPESNISKEALLMQSMLEYNPIVVFIRFTLQRYRQLIRYLIDIVDFGERAQCSQVEPPSETLIEKMLDTDRRFGSNDSTVPSTNNQPTSDIIPLAEVESSKAVNEEQSSSTEPDSSSTPTSKPSHSETEPSTVINDQSESGALNQVFDAEGVKVPFDFEAILKAAEWENIAIDAASVEKFQYLPVPTVSTMGLTAAILQHTENQQSATEPDDSNNDNYNASNNDNEPVETEITSTEASVDIALPATNTEETQVSKDEELSTDNSNSIVSDTSETASTNRKPTLSQEQISQLVQHLLETGAIKPTASDSEINDIAQLITKTLQEELKNYSSQSINQQREQQPTLSTAESSDTKTSVKPIPSDATQSNTNDPSNTQAPQQEPSVLPNSSESPDTEKDKANSIHHYEQHGGTQSVFSEATKTTPQPLEKAAHIPVNHHDEAGTTLEETTGTQSERDKHLSQQSQDTIASDLFERMRARKKQQQLQQLQHESTGRNTRSQVGILERIGPLQLEIDRRIQLLQQQYNGRLKSQLLDQELDLGLERINGPVDLQEYQQHQHRLQNYEHSSFKPQSQYLHSNELSIPATPDFASSLATPGTGRILPTTEELSPTPSGSMSVFQQLLLQQQMKARARQMYNNNNTSTSTSTSSASANNPHQRTHSGSVSVLFTSPPSNQVPAIHTEPSETTPIQRQQSPLPYSTRYHGSRLLHDAHGHGAPLFNDFVEHP